MEGEVAEKMKRKSMSLLIYLVCNRDKKADRSRLSLHFFQEIVPGGKQNCTAKVKPIGNHFECRWCHFYTDITLCNQHSLLNDLLQQKRQQNNNNNKKKSQLPVWAETLSTLCTFSGAQTTHWRKTTKSIRSQSPFLIPEYQLWISRD